MGNAHCIQYKSLTNSPILIIISFVECWTAKHLTLLSSISILQQEMVVRLAIAMHSSCVLKHRS